MHNHNPNNNTARRRESNSPVFYNPQFKDFLDKCPTEKGEYSDCDVVEDELNVYLKKKIKDTYNVLEFWKTADDVPLLKQLAKQILSIPASSATSERVFSTSGRILEKSRSRFLSKNDIKILFLHKNM